MLRNNLWGKKYNLTFLHLELRGRYNPTHPSGLSKGDKSKMVVGVLLDVTMERKERLFPITRLKVQCEGGKLEQQT